MLTKSARTQDEYAGRALSVLIVNVEFRVTFEQNKTY